MNVVALRSRRVRKEQHPADQEADGESSVRSFSSGSQAAGAPSSLALLPITPNHSMEAPLHRTTTSSISSATGDSLVERAVPAAPARSAQPPSTSQEQQQPQQQLPQQPHAACSVAALREQAALAAAAIERAAREQAARHAAARARAAAELASVEGAKRALEARLMLVRDTAALRREEAAAAQHGGTAGWGRAVAEVQGRMAAARQQAEAEQQAREAAFAKEQRCWTARHGAAVAAIAGLQREATAELQHLQAELGVGLAEELEGGDAPWALTAAAAAAGSAAAAASTLDLPPPAAGPSAEHPPVVLPPPRAAAAPLEQHSSSGASMGASGAGGSSVDGSGSGFLVQTPLPCVAPVPALRPRTAADWGEAVAEACCYASASDEEWHDCEEAAGEEATHPPQMLAAAEACAGSSAAARQRTSGGRRRRKAGPTEGAVASAGCCTIM